MSKWDELEKAARESRPAEWWIDSHKAVLSLIEQNKRMRAALKSLRGFTVSPTEIEIIDEVIGDDQ